MQEDVKKEEPKEKLFESAYLGDGVYASFDGYQIWIAVNDHTNRILALDPDVTSALVRYAQAINRVFDSDHFYSLGKGKE